MENWSAINFQSLITITLSALVIYFTVITFTRIFGKRSFSKMSSFDFIMTIAVGSVIATTILSTNVSLVQGIVGLFMLFLFQMMIALLRRYKPFRKAIDNTPLLLMDGSHILKDNLRKARVTEGDLRSKLREANVLDLSEVRAVVFETTGDIMVLHTNEPSKELSSWMLKDVLKK